MHDSTSQVDRTEKRVKELVDIALEVGKGVSDVVLISTSDISVENDLASLCREPRCGNYGASAKCPPYVSGPSGFRAWLNSCEYALVIRIEVPMKNLLSYELRGILKLLHEIVADIEKSAVELGYSNSKAFAAGCCKELFCREHADCNVLVGGEKCRHPRYARPSLSGFGINVYELTKTAGWSVNRDVNEVNAGQISMGALYGLILIG